MTKEREEVTLPDVMDAVATMGVRLDSVIEIMDTRFDRVDQRVGFVEVGLHDLNDSVRDMNHQLGKVEVRVADMQEDLGGLMRAVDADAETLVGHESRIASLEEVRS